MNEDNNINKYPSGSDCPKVARDCDSVPQRRMHASEIVQKLEAENEYQRDLIHKLKQHNHELDEENRVLRRMVKEQR